MTIAEKILRVKDDYDAVYESGYEKGKAEGGNSEESYNEGFEAGKKSEYDAFWDAYQNNGNPKDYSTAFGGVGWNNQTFKPKYDIVPTNAYMIFRGNTLAVDLVEYLNGLGVALDLSQAVNTQYMFNASKFTRVGVVDVSGSTNSTPLDNCFANCQNLVTIDKLIPKTGSNGEFGGTFNNCPKLENLTIEGTITKNGLNLQTSTKLSRASIISVVNALSPTTSGQTVTLSKTAVENAFDDVATVIPFSFTAETEGANVTGVDNGDGTATFNGTIAQDTYFSYGNATDVFSAGSYTILFPNNTGQFDYSVSLYDLDGNKITEYYAYFVSDATATFTTDKDFVMKSRLYASGGREFNNEVIAYPTISENLIKYPYVDSEIQIDIFGYIRSNSDGTITICTEDCSLTSTGMYNFRLCTLTLPAGRYKMTSTSDNDIGLYGDELSFDVVDTAIEEIFVSTNGSNGSYEFTLTEEKEVTFTYLFNMLTPGSRYTVTPSLVRINETDWDALTATKPNWTIIEA